MTKSLGMPKLMRCNLSSFPPCSKTSDSSHPRRYSLSQAVLDGNHDPDLTNVAVEAHQEQSEAERTYTKEEVEALPIAESDALFKKLWNMELGERCTTSLQQHQLMEHLASVGAPPNGVSTFLWKRLVLYCALEGQILIVGWPYGVPFPSEDPNNKGWMGVTQLKRRKLTLYLFTGPMKFVKREEDTTDSKSLAPVSQASQY